MGCCGKGKSARRASPTQRVIKPAPSIRTPEKIMVVYAPNNMFQITKRMKPEEVAGYSAAVFLIGTFTGSESNLKTLEKMDNAITTEMKAIANFFYVDKDYFDGELPNKFPSIVVYDKGEYKKVINGVPFDLGKIINESLGVSNNIDTKYEYKEITVEVNNKLQEAYEKMNALIQDESNRSELINIDMKVVDGLLIATLTMSR